MTNPLVSIIIPTFNNAQYLHGAVNSILRNQVTKNMLEIIVVNNGHKNSCDFLGEHPQVKLIQAGKNLGWEGGIMEGLKHSTSEFFCMFNDDAMIPTSSRMWLHIMLQHFRDDKVAAVGPSSNVVMGLQNIFNTDVPYHVFESKFLIGFCVLMRRRVFDGSTGMDLSLPGGDDFDWSIRLRDKGYKLLIDRTVFVYHHGFKTGERVHGTPSTPNGWNSYEKQHKINTALIKKHGLKKWFETLKGSYQWPEISYSQPWEDSEGHTIRGLIDAKTDKHILDLGCGGNKTIESAIGVDFVPKGDRIPTLEGDPVSSADIMADVSKELPVKDESQDVIIARHILEHMQDPIFVINHWVKKLKKGGRLILALPNQDWHSTIPMNLEHVHSYTPKSTITLLSAFGLKVSIADSHNSISFIAIGEKV